MTESAIVRSSAAKVRAFWDRVLWRASAAVCAIWFHVAQIGGVQNCPICVWSGGRVEPCAAPRALTSLIAAAYFGLVSASGGGGRNSLARRITNGLTCGQCVKDGGGKGGGGGGKAAQARAGGVSE